MQLQKFRWTQSYFTTTYKIFQGFRDFIYHCVELGMKLAKQDDEILIY